MPTVVVFQPEGNFANNPALSAMLELLCEHGLDVDVVVPRKPFHQGSLHPRMRVRRYSPLVARLLRYLTLVDFGAHLLSLGARLFGRKLVADVVVGVDPVGIVVARAFAEALGAPLVMFSYEIFFESEVGPRRKRIEREACRDVRLLVVPDRIRAASMERENAIPANLHMLMPVAPRGLGRAVPGNLRAALRIPDGQRIAVFLGSLEPWSLLDPVLASVDAWPSDWCLVVHHRYGASADIADKVSRCPPKRVFLSSLSCPTTAELGLLLGDADAGIALYRATYDSIYTGENIAQIGLSSGKVSTFLSYGVPLVVSEGSLIERHVRDRRLGSAVRDASGIADALQAISLQHPDIRERCRDFFVASLDANRNGPNVARCIAALATDRVRMGRDSAS